VLELAAESTNALGFEPTVLFDGPIDAHIEGTSPTNSPQ